MRVTSIVLLTVTTAHAFQAPQAAVLRQKQALNAIALDPETIMAPPTPPAPKPQQEEDIDLTGVALSGLAGKPLAWKDEDYPTTAQVRSILPEGSTEPDTMRSLGYLSVSVLGTAACTAVGCGMLSFLNPANPLTWPIWTAYAAVTGTVAMGLWVLAHECGHGAFSRNKGLQDAVGYALHTLFLVPYYSWQHSHAVHHQYTNNIELGETHVPELSTEEDEGSLKKRRALLEAFGEEKGTIAWGVLQTFLHLGVGWPAYLLIGATGGKDRGLTNHYYPEPLQPDTNPTELFPGVWKERVYKSDIGIAAMIGSLIAWSVCNGPAQMMAIYGGPYLVVNAWLVLYTWLQHTDVDVPHFSKEDHTYIKGVFHTIDRPYDKLDPWGLIDFLHHKIGTTHVAHHFDSRIPHYKAEAATEAIKENFPQFYLYEPTPIPQAMWRIAKGSAAVEKRGKKWIWNNKEVEGRL